MSFMRPVLNVWQRLTERARIARAQTAEPVRRGLERSARLFFRGPRGVRYRWDETAGLQTRWVMPEASKGGPIILYFHGGAYVFGSPRTHQAMLGQLAHRTGLVACLPRYRLAPEHGFPAAPEDALAVYKALVSQNPEGIILGGDSAGGGLALVLLSQILAERLTPPLGVFAIAPLTDMTQSGDSLRRNDATEVVLPTERFSELIDMVLQGAEPSDPRASPLFADFHGAPPVWLTASDSEILLDDTRRMAQRLRQHGVQVDEIIAPGLSHVWPILHNLLPEARATLDQIAGWIKSLPR